MILRLFLVFSGGQHWFPDEARYDWTLEILHRGISAIQSNPQHPGFFLLMLPVAALETGIGHLLGVPLELLSWIPATFNALASVAVIALIYGIAWRVSGERPIAFSSAIFAAASAPLLYYCRHLVPYDSALAFGLLAVYLALAESPAWYIGVLAAVSAIFSITVYQGSVLFACVCVLLVLYHLRGQPRPLVSFIATLSLPVLCLALFGGATFWNRIHDFSKAASQGWYSEGTSIPWLYLWSAEHAFFLLLLVGLVAGLRGATRVYSVATLVLYSLMILASFGLNLWPIYGRTARTLLPFFCIAAGGGWHRSFKDLYRLAGDRAIQMRRGLAAAALIQVAFNFAPIVTQKFPAEINREMARYYQFDTAASVGPCPASPAGESKASVTLLNSGYLWPVECFAEERRGRVIYQTRHPFQYEPYSFESYTAPQRDMLKRTDISIRLLQR